MKDLDVLVKRVNGSYRASVPSLPEVTAEGQSREEALTNVRRAAEDYLATAQVATITVELPPIQAELEAHEYPFAEAWLRAARLPRQDPNDPDYQRYLAILADDKLRQRDAVMRELENAAAANNPAPEFAPGSPKALLKAIAACRIDPNDKLYQQYVAAMEAEEQRQWEEFERENPETV